MGDDRIERMEPRRLFASYTPDVSFGRDGALAFGQAEYGPRNLGTTLIHADSRGLLVARATLDGKETPLRLERYTTAGAPDPTYTPRTLPKSYKLDSVYGDRQGRILYVKYPKSDALTVTRYTADGMLDTTFGRQGTATAVAGLGLNDARLTVAADGSIYLSAYSSFFTEEGYLDYDRRYVCRFDAAGRPDTAFGTNGILTLGKSDEIHGNGDFFFATTPQNGLVIGQVQNYGETFTFTRYTPAGRVDTTFATNGVYTYTAEDDIASYTAALDAQGRPLLLSQDKTIELRRLTPGGRPDTTFANAGVAAVTIGGKSPSYARSLFVQADGRIVLQVEKNRRPYLVRLNGDGGRDATFGDGGLADVTPIENVPGGYNLQTIVAELGDGSYLTSEETNYGTTLEKLGPAVAVRRGTTGRLYLTGGEASDTVVLSRNFNDTIRVVFNGQTRDILNVVRGVSANLGGGDNRLDADVNVPQIVRTSDGNDTIRTGAGDDFIRSAGGRDTIVTRGGVDKIRFDGGDKDVDAGTGGGTVAGGGGSRRGAGSAGPPGYVRVVTTGADQDADADWTIDVRGQRINVSVGGGTATVVASASLTALVNADGVRDRVTANVVARRVYLSSRRATTEAYVNATVAADVGTGPGDDQIRCGDGDDTVFGGTGDDRIYGGEGDDSLLGGEGDDRLVGGLGNDRLFGQDGNDRLYAGEVASRAAAAANYLDGGPGRDRYRTEGDEDRLRRLELALGDAV